MSLRLLSAPLVIFWVAVALIPPFWSYAPSFEARNFPVVDDVQVAGDTETDSGVVFFVSFKKLRQCDFLGISWYDGETRLTLDFAPREEGLPISRPVGGHRGSCSPSLSPALGNALIFLRLGA